jgi:DNA replication and repair protein RecF
VGSAQLVRHGQKGYFLGSTVVSQARHETRLYWSPTQRALSLDGRPVRRLTDYLGVLRTVVFSTEDLLLVKGPGKVRRRFLDLLLSQTVPAYLPLLQRYTRALRARNLLLKRRTPDPASLESFSRELVTAGEALIRSRRTLLPQLSPLARLAYQQISRDKENLQIEYLPSVKADFAVELAQSREREQAYRATVVGPHRDELQLSLDAQPAGEFASEGQKRTLAVALKMAQADYLARVHGSPPVLLIDDVMGELDLERRSGLLPLLDRTHTATGQVFMTATERNWPRDLGRAIQTWTVKAGTLDFGGCIPPEGR